MRIRADYLVVGSGLAGLYFALQAVGHGSCLLIAKEELEESNTNYAQGGIAAVLDPRDSFASHIEDTLVAGDGLCVPEVVEQIVQDGPGVIRELIELGIHFTRRNSGALSLGREGGHAAARVAHADDLTGRELVRTLVAACQRQARIQCLDQHLALELIVDPQGGCQGVWALDKKTGKGVECRAPVVMLATGGCGQLYLHTTNPPGATGDGIAMAYQAGAKVGNLEFVQFHPTMLYQPQGAAFLISEAVRGYGGVLVNHRGERFVDRRHPQGSLATRDVVARAIVDELLQSGRECVYLDVTGKPPEATRSRFPNIYRHCLETGVDMTSMLIPVVPAAHYMCGGVCTDLQGRTGIEGLYAAGEIAMTGFHGANRLASNSLLEALVMAKRAFQHACRQRRPVLASDLAWPPGSRRTTGQVPALRERLQRCMWEKVGIIRTDRGLEDACREIADLTAVVEQPHPDHLPDPQLVALRNMITTAGLVGRAARLRLESRGGHYNSDHPERDDARWQVPILMQKDNAGLPIEVRR